MSNKFWWVFGVTLAVLVVGYFTFGASINVFTGSARTSPPAPSDLAAVFTSYTDGSVALSWKDNSKNEKAFKIYRKYASNSFSDPSFDTSYDWKLIATVPARSVSYSDKITAAGTYSYQVFACLT